MLESSPAWDCMYNPLISADEAESIVLVRLSMLGSVSRMVARLSCTGFANGVRGLAGESWGGGGSGSGFARLFCKLKLRACCVLDGATALPGRGAEVVAFSNGMLDCDGLRRASCEGCRASLVLSARPGARFLMPRKADDMRSEGDLDEGEGSARASDSVSEKRLESPKDFCWPGLPNVSPDPDMSARLA